MHRAQRARGAEGILQLLGRGAQDFGSAIAASLAGSVSLPPRRAASAGC